MARKPWLSIRGLYLMNNNVFSEMVLPQDLEAEILQNEIMEECAELEVLFPDPDFMQKSLGWWSTSRLYAWNQMMETLRANYNPIWNKDGTINETRTYGEMNSSGEGNGFVSGYNSEALVNNTKSTSKSKLDQHVDGIQRIEQGNIGVTTTQSMIHEELELRAEYDMYKIIVSEFKAKYCLLVY